MLGMAALFGGLNAAAGIAGNKISQNSYYKHQSQLIDKQNAYNTKMWHMQNAYNSPANMRKLLQEGGFNPDLMYQNGGFANAEAPQPSSEGSPYQSDLSSTLQNAVSTSMQMPQSIAQYQAQQLSNQHQKLENDTYMVRTMAELEKLKADTKNSQTQNQINEIISRWTEDLNRASFESMQLENEGKRLTNKILENQATQSAYETMMKAIDASNYPQQKQQEIEKMGKEIIMLGAQYKLNSKQLEMLGAQIGIIGVELQKAEGQKELRGWCEQTLGKKGTSVAYGLLDFFKGLGSGLFK